MQSLADLMSVLPQRGVVAWIGLRPARHEAMQVVERVLARTDQGLQGDRYAKAGGKRQVTLIQGEHLDALGSMLASPSRPGDRAIASRSACRPALDRSNSTSIAPELVRRNLVVRGINLLALKDRRFRVGDAVLEYTGLAHPCSRMEAALGPGGYNAMRGHGGITARVVEGGMIAVADGVEVLPGRGAAGDAG